MQETLQQREAAMRDVLRKIQDKTDFNDFTFEQKRIAKECFDSGFFEGVVLIEMISGRIVAEYQHEPRLTHKGLQFLYPEQKLEERSAQNRDHSNEPTNHIFKTFKFSWNVFWWILGAIATILTIVGGWNYVKTAYFFVISLFSL